MNKEEPDIDKKYEEEKLKLQNELEEWERCYQRFKSKFDEISDYEERIAELEAELKERERVFKINLDTEKDRLIAISILFVISYLVFIKVVYGSKNVWLFFIAGAITGLGFATLIRVWKK